MNGIDISAGSAVDFMALKQAGYEFVICRAGYGSKNLEKQKDRDLHANIMGAVAAGLHVGAYWFMYCTTLPEAKENAMRCHEALLPYAGLLDMPVFVDYEGDSTRYYEQYSGQKETKDFATAAINICASQLEQLGWFTGVYLNPDYIKNHVRLDELRRYSLWLAQWKNFDNNPAYQCDMWQFAGDTRLHGIANGAVDLDYCYKDYPAIIRERGLNGFEKGSAISLADNAKDKIIRLKPNGTWCYEV